MNVYFGKNKLLGNNTVKSRILNDETFYKTFQEQTFLHGNKWNGIS